MFEHIEPFSGWLHIYDPAQDRRSPFYGVEHNQFFFDRYIYTYQAHPLWEYIESESLLVKLLYVNYRRGFAVIELLGEWNDLFQNDFKLLCEHCLYPLMKKGVNRFALITENVFQLYLQSDEYYRDLQDRLEDGWVALVNARPNVVDELRRLDLLDCFHLLTDSREVRWRKQKPWELYYQVTGQPKLQDK